MSPSCTSTSPRAAPRSGWPGLAARRRELGEAADDEVGGDAFWGAHWARSIGADGAPSRRSRPHARRAARGDRGLPPVPARHAAADPVGARGAARADRGPGARHHRAGARAAVRRRRRAQADRLAGAARHRRPRGHARALRVRRRREVLPRAAFPAGAATARRTAASARAAGPGRTRSCASAIPRSSFPSGASRSTTGSGGRRSTHVIGRRFERDGRIIVPLPHPSGASAWTNDAANRALVEQAVAQLRDTLP